MHLQQRTVLKTTGTSIIANYSPTQFPHISYAFLYVCLVVCIFITGRDLSNYYTGKDIDIFHYHKYIFLCCPFIINYFLLTINLFCLKSLLNLRNYINRTTLYIMLFFFLFNQHPSIENHDRPKLLWRTTKVVAHINHLFFLTDRW